MMDHLLVILIFLIYLIGILHGYIIGTRLR